MVDIVNDLSSWKGRMEHLVRCECTRGWWSRDHDLIEVLEWAIRMVQHKAFRVKGLLFAVLEPGHYLTLQVMTKLKAYVVDQMEGLINDSYQCQSSLDRFIMEYEPDSGSPPSTLHSMS
jgi:hypothetical protein